MRAIVFDTPGDPSVLHLAERPLPNPAPDEVRVRVHASGLNRADLLQRRGLYPPPKGFPTDILGIEYAGVVDIVGREVTHVVPGDNVMGIVGGGAYAEYVTVRAAEVMRAPVGMTLRDAAAVPEAFLTAHDALSNEAAVRTGETVLVHAVGSGVGTALLQLATLAGARVIGTSRSKDKLDRARALGLTHAVQTTGDWQSEVRSIAPDGLDAVVDLVGGKLVAQTLVLLRDRGRYVLVGLTGGATAELDLGRLLAKRIILRGTVLRTRPFDEKVRLARALEQSVLPAFAAGHLKPVIDSVIAPDAIAAAHERLERNESFGKIVLSWAV